MIDLCVGDWIRVRCKEHMIDPSLERERVFEGQILSIFNAFTVNGEDNWIIEIKCHPVGWFLYKPHLDGGVWERISPDDISLRQYKKS